MELDDMKAAWARVDLRQDALEALLRHDHHQHDTDAARATMRRTLLRQVLAVIGWLAWAVVAASFWVAHRHTPHLLAVGLLLHGYGLVGLASSIVRLVLLGRVHAFDAPVLVLQRRLARLRRYQLVSSLALGLPWWFLWFVVPMAAWTWWSGVDAFAASPWWQANLAAGTAGLLLSLWLARHLAGRTLRPAWLQGMVDDLSGRSLARVARQLEAMARFERE